jgi:hypothetical protein
VFPLFFEGLFETQYNISGAVNWAQPFTDFLETKKLVSSFVSSFSK